MPRREVACGSWVLREAPPCRLSCPHPQPASWCHEGHSRSSPWGKWRVRLGPIPAWLRFPSAFLYSPGGHLFSGLVTVKRSVPKLILLKLVRVTPAKCGSIFGTVFLCSDVSKNWFRIETPFNLDEDKNKTWPKAVSSWPQFRA